MRNEGVLKERAAAMAPTHDEDHDHPGMVERVRAGKSFEDLLAHRETVFRICLGFCRDYAEAEDLAQDVYLKAYRNIGVLKDAGFSKEWLFRIAKNACLDRQKKNRTRSVLLHRWAEGEKHRDDREPTNSVDDRLTGLKDSIRRLPKKLRSVFIFRIYVHLTYEEIAAALDLAEGTVMSRLNRARKRLAEMMKEDPQ